MVGYATWVSILSNGNNLLISSIKRTIKVHIDGRLLNFMCAIKSLDVLSHDVYTLIVLKVGVDRLLGKALLLKDES